MSNYTDKLADISRTPVTLAVITLDFCGNTFGSSPCTATGTKCYNTYPTCRDKTRYVRGTKDYKIVSASARLAFPGPRPYIEAISYYPTEIKTALTVKNRVKIRCHDEPDTDIGVDPYVADRSIVQGTYWKKLLVRNPNYKRRPIKIYEGFVGLAEADYQQRFAGVLDNITLDGSLRVTIECVDLLKLLSETTIPLKSSTKLISGISASDTTLTLNAVDDLAAAGYVRIADEIIQYTAKNATTNQITGCTRGAFSTIATTHSAKNKVQPCTYFAPDNPYEHMKTILTLGGVSATEIDTAAFNALKTSPYPDINYSAIISDPVDADQLYFELINLLDCRTWVSEDLKITIAKTMPNVPGRAYTAISDALNIASGSGRVDLNAASRVSRVLLYWDLPPLSNVDTRNEYGRLDIAIDAEAESDNEYDEPAELELFCRWISQGWETEEHLDAYVENLVKRRLCLYRDPLHIISVSVELKDEALKTGGYVRLTTDLVNSTDGSPIQAVRHQIVKREQKGAKIDISVQELHSRKIAWIGDDTFPANYNDATDAQREYGCYIPDEKGYLPDLSPGNIIF